MIHFIYSKQYINDKCFTYSPWYIQEMFYNIEMIHDFYLVSKT